MLFEWSVWSVVRIDNFSKTCVSILHISALGQGTRYSNVPGSLIPQLRLLAEATIITCRLVIPLLNAAFRQSVPSQIPFCITCGFAASH